MPLRSLPMQSVQLFWVVHNSWLSSNQRTRARGVVAVSSSLLGHVKPTVGRFICNLLAALKSADSTFDQDPERNDWFAQRGFVKPSAHDAACSSQVLELRNMRTLQSKVLILKRLYESMTLPYFALHLSSLQGTLASFLADSKSPC